MLMDHCKGATRHDRKCLNTGGKDTPSGTEMSQMWAPAGWCRWTVTIEEAEDTQRFVCLGTGFSCGTFIIM